MNAQPGKPGKRGQPSQGGRGGQGGKGGEGGAGDPKGGGGKGGPGGSGGIGSPGFVKRFDLNRVNEKLIAKETVLTPMERIALFGCFIGLVFLLGGGGSG